MKLNFPKRSLPSILNNFLFYSLILYFIGLFIFALLAPIIQSIYGYPAGESIYSLFEPICHQYPSRSIWILGLPMALCTRCSFVYLGFGIGLFALRLRFRIKTNLLIGVLIIIFFGSDWFLQAFKIYEGNNLIRSISGLGLGFGGSIIINPLSYRRNK